VSFHISSRALASVCAAGFVGFFGCAGQSPEPHEASAAGSAAPVVTAAPASAPSVTAAVAPSAIAAGPVPSADPAAELHRSAIVVDTHNDVTERLVTENIDIGQSLPDGQTDVPRMVAGGLDAEFLSVWIAPQLYPGNKAYTQAIAEFDAIDAIVAKHSDAVVLARTAAEVRAAAARGKTAFLIGVEGGHALGDGSSDELLGRLKEFYRRGARYMTLTWSNSNRIGGSSGDKGRTRGLSAFGKQVVATMNALGMMVDISHVSDATFFDAVHASKSPVIASHSSSRALADRPRNMTDDMLRAVGENGGAVCVNFGPEFLDVAWHEAFEKAQKEAKFDPASIAKANGPDPKKAQLAIWTQMKEIARSVPPVPASRAVDHIEHIAKVAGIDHVCLGSDFDGVPTGLAGLKDVSEFPFLTAELLRRGFEPADVKKILGENVLRVLEENERRGSATEHDASGPRP
jgi:membrane dipeptidase